jgi:lipopolysaccharide export system protein LptA
MFLAGYAGADTYKINPPSLELKVCKSSVCNNIPLPLVENSENSTYSLRDFDNDGIPEVIVTEDPQLSQGINVTSFIYRIEKNNLILIKTSTGDDAAMGNISFHKDKIISSYRSGPIWYQDIYHYSHGVFVREMQDRNGELRTIFNETETEKFILPVDTMHSVDVDCRLKYRDEKSINLTLLSGENRMPTIQTTAFNGENCKQIVFSGYDFDGDRQNDVFIINGDQVIATQQIFLVDAKNKTLLYAGNLPVNHEYQSDGTYLYEEVSPSVKSKTIYVFSDKKLAIKKTTSLVFDGNVCLDNSGINISCEHGQKATRELPVCYVRDNSENYHIVPLTKCDIKKEEVSDLHE